MDNRLAEKAGYKDAKDYFSKHLADLSQPALTLYGAVAKAFSEPVTRRYGVTCLYLLLTYKEATDIEVNHEDPEGTLIEVPDDKGQLLARPFGQCTVEQLRRALLHRRKPGSTKPLPPEAELRAGQSWPGSAVFVLAAAAAAPPEHHPCAQDERQDGRYREHEHNEPSHSQKCEQP